MSFHDNKISQKHSTNPEPIANLLDSMKQTDLNPPYQRGDVWPDSMKVALIESIFRDIPIGVFHFVEINDVTNFRAVLDGKQRLHAIDKFSQNKLRVNCGLVDEDDRAVLVTYRDLLESRDARMAKILNRFQRFSPLVTLWESMSLEEQRNIFVHINYSKSLNKNEQIYCSNYLAKAVYTDLFKTCIKPNLEFHLEKRFSTNQRSNGTALAHKICRLAFGDVLSGGHKSVHLTWGYLKDSAVELENRLHEVSFKEDDAFAEEVQDKLGAKSNVARLKKVCKFMGRVLDNRSGLSKKDASSVSMQDFMVTLLKKEEYGELTFAQMNAATSELYDIFVWFCEQKKVNSDYTQRTTQASSIRDRIKLLESKIDEVIDCKQKSSYIPKQDKALAKLKSNDTCPGCGQKLTAKNSQIDHINPASLSSTTDYRVFCDVCNNRMGNLTADEMRKLADAKELESQLSV